MSLENELQQKIDIEEVEEAHTQPVLDYLNSPKNVEIMQNFDGEGQATAQSRKWKATIWIYLEIREDKF